MPSPFPRRPRRALGLALAALVVPALSVTVSPGDPAAGSTPAARTTSYTAGPVAAAARKVRPMRARANTDPDFVSVWVNNVENLETASKPRCRGDYHDLVSAMRQSKFKPDIFLVQQLSGRRQLRQYTRYLSNRLGERYEGVVAKRSPTPQKSPCGAAKAQQTNAVIYRAARFVDNGLGARTWQADRFVDGRCANNKQDRSQAIKVQLTDTIAKRSVVAASIHWPTAKVHGPECAETNAYESGEEMREDGYRGALYLLGGDTNVGDRGRRGGFRTWYRDLNGDIDGIGFRDVVYDACGGKRSCLADHATVRSGARIDFLLTQRRNGSRGKVGSVRTLTFDEADRLAALDTGRDDPDLSYSDHQAVVAKVFY